MNDALKISRADWDALSEAVVIAEVAIRMNLIATKPEQVQQVGIAREILTHADIEKAPGSKRYLPSRHPDRNN